MHKVSKINDSSAYEQRPMTVHMTQNPQGARTDENIGFNFNDGSKMITLEPNNQAVKYFDKKKVDDPD